MESVLGACAFAGIVAAQLLAVVAMHNTKLIERAERERAERIAALLWRSVIRLKSQWKPTLAMVALLASVVVAGTQETTGADTTRPAQGPSMTCAGRDADLLTLIEYLGEAPSFAGDKLFKVQLAMMDARDVCAQGRESAALSLYDRAVLDLVFRAETFR